MLNDKAKILFILFVFLLFLSLEIISAQPTQLVRNYSLQKNSERKFNTTVPTSTATKANESIMSRNVTLGTYGGWNWTSNFTYTTNINITQRAITALIFCNATRYLSNARANITKVELYDCGTSATCAGGKMIARNLSPGGGAGLAGGNCNSTLPTFNTSITFSNATANYTMHAGDRIGLGIYVWARNATINIWYNSSDLATRFNLSEVEANNTAPNVTILFPTTNNTNTTNNVLNINYTYADVSGISSCWYSNSSGRTNITLTSCTNITGITWIEGLNNITLWINDTYGNDNSTSISFRLDTTKPNINITTPINNTNSSDAGLDINYTASDSGIGLFNCWYSNDSYLANTSLADCGTNITTINWTEGNHNVTIWANDTLGNVNFSKIFFSIVNPPVINSYSDAPDPVMNGSYVTINANVTDNIVVSSAWVYINGTNYTMSRLVSGSLAPIFYDDFESGTLNANNWNLTADNNYWTTSSTDVYEGTYNAELFYTKTGYFSYMEKSIDTTNYNNINLSFYKKLIGLDKASDEFRAEWFDGTNWNVLENVHSIDEVYNFTSFLLPVQADNNPNLKIRFVCSAKKKETGCRIDNVNITGSISSIVGDIWEYKYPTTRLGNFNYTIFANDTDNNNITSSEGGNFTVLNLNVTINENVVNTLGDEINITFEILNQADEIIYNETNTFHHKQVEKGEYKLKIRPKDSSIKSITFEGVNVTSDINGLMDIEEGTQYAIHTKISDFKNISMKISSAVGKRLLKCSNWSFDEEECIGNWTTLMSLIPGEEYEIILNVGGSFAFLEIPIVDAQHLDSSRVFISNIYNETATLDDIWSEAIDNNEYVRVTFEQNLTNLNDITIYPRVAQGNPHINVYEKDSAVQIASFDPLVDNELNKIYLTDLISSSQDTFDLQVESGRVEFDYIVDPVAVAGTNGTVSGSNAQILNFTHTLVSGTNRLIVVGVSYENTGKQNVSNITYGNQFMTKAISMGNMSVISTGFIEGVEIWYLLEADLPADGAQSVNVSFNQTGVAQEANAWVSEYTGVFQGPPEAIAGENVTTAKTINNTISPSANAWVISVMGSGNTGFYNKTSSSQVMIVNISRSSSGFAVSEVRGAVGGSQLLNATFQRASNRQSMVSASFAAYTEVSTCTYSGTGNWAITCSDNCDITSNVAGDGSQMTMIGKGRITLNANITNFNLYHISGGCNVTCAKGCIKYDNL